MDFKSFFKNCDIVTYQLFSDSNGSIPYDGTAAKIAGQTLQLMRNIIQTNEVVYLQAATNGNRFAFQEFEITVNSRCTISTIPLSGGQKEKCFNYNDNRIIRI